MAETLLPVNATAQERAMEGAVARVSDVPVLVRASWDPDSCPSALLPWLAWAFMVDEWDADWTDEQKRTAINVSVGVHRHKGTPGAMKRALAPLGLDIQVNEWHQKTPMAAPYTFSALVIVDQVGIPDADGFDRIVRVANGAKNTRSHMTGVDILGKTTSAINFSGAVICGETVTIAAEA